MNTEAPWLARVGSTARAMVLTGLLGALAAVVPVALYGWLHWASFRGDGLGGIGLMAAAGAAALGGLAGGAVLGAFGFGVWRWSLGRMFRMTGAAILGALVGAWAGQAAFGVGNEAAIVKVLAADLAGAFLAMAVFSEAFPGWRRKRRARSPGPDHAGC